MDVLEKANDYLMSYDYIYKNYKNKLPINMKASLSRLFVFTLLISTIFVSLHARSSLDSLKQLVDNAEGSLRTEYSIQLAKKLIEYSRLNEGISLAKEVLDEGKKSDDLMLQLQGYGILARAYLLAGDLNSSIAYGDSTLNLAREKNNRYGLGLGYQASGTPKMYVGNVEGAIATLDSSLAIFNEEEYPQEHAISKLYLASVLATTGKPDESFGYLNDAKRIFLAHNDFYKAATIDLNIGLVKSSVLGLYEEALSISLGALPYFESVDDSVKIATCSNTIGNCYDGIGSYDKAIEYYEAAVNMMGDNGNILMTSNFINNLGEVYKHKEDYENARKYYGKALEIFLQYGINEGVIVAENNIGECLMAENKYGEALSYFKESLSKVDVERDFYKSTILYKNIGAVHLKTNNLASAESYLNKSITAAKTLGSKEELFPAYEKLAEVYEKRGDYRNAFKYHKLYVDTKDEFIKNSNSKIISELETKYQTEKKDKEIQLLTKNQEIQDLQLFNQQAYTVGLIVVLLLLGGFAVSIYKRLQVKRRLNEELEERNNQIEVQKNELKDINEKLSYANERLVASEADLKELNATKDKFFSVIAHDLKGPFSSLLGLTELLAEDAETMTEEDIQKIGQGIHNASRQAFTLTENLLEWARAQLNMLNVKREFFDFNELVNNNARLYKSNLQAKRIILDKDLCEESMINTDKDMVDFALRNLIQNAIKFTRQEGKIKISSKVENNLFKVQIADTGVGIPKEDIDNLFKIESTFTRAGTEEEEGTGLGLVLVREFIEKIGGEITVESRVDEGTKFTFTIPIAA